MKSKTTEDPSSRCTRRAVVESLDIPSYLSRGIYGPHELLADASTCFCDEQTSIDEQEFRTVSYDSFSQYAPSNPAQYIPSTQSLIPNHTKPSRYETRDAAEGTCSEIRTSISINGKKSAQVALSPSGYSIQVNGEKKTVSCKSAQIFIDINCPDPLKRVDINKYEQQPAVNSIYKQQTEFSRKLKSVSVDATNGPGGEHPDTDYAVKPMKSLKITCECSPNTKETEKCLYCKRNCEASPIVDDDYTTTELNADYAVKPIDKHKSKESIKSLKITCECPPNIKETEKCLYCKRNCEASPVANDDHTTMDLDAESSCKDMTKSKNISCECIKPENSESNLVHGPVEAKETKRKKKFFFFKKRPLPKAECLCHYPQ